MSADTPSSPTAQPPRRDQVYATARASVDAFRFDEQVAGVFADMIARSVPGYALTLQMIAVATREFARPDTVCYDLGCSLGASTLSMRHHAPAGCRIVGVDNSPAMAARCREIVATDSCPVEVQIHCADICDIPLEPTSLVAMNFTLQFVPMAARAALLARIAAALQPGGCLLLSEKLAFEDPQEQLLLQQLHHGFKQLQGYSQMEIAQKRAALENVLLPESLQTHRERLRAAGFSHINVGLQCLNFVTLLAQK